MPAAKLHAIQIIAAGANSQASDFARIGVRITDSYRVAFSKLRSTITAQPSSVANDE
jgi:hypothetical protein